MGLAVEEGRWRRERDDAKDFMIPRSEDLVDWARFQFWGVRCAIEGIEGIMVG